jgi:putative membrane protein
MKKKRNGLFSYSEKIAVTVIGIFHLAGIILLNWSSGFLYSLALDFVPINLILTSLLVIKFQKEYSGRFWIFSIIAILSGFFVEMAGVNTGLIFGHYQYGDVLGPGILGTPWIIGLNWFLLSYCILCLLDFLTWPAWVKFFLATGLMVGLDYLMEPVAMRLGFWSWEEGNIPVQNYVGWAALSALIFLQPFFNSFQRKNRVAAAAFIIQVLFFLLQNIF